MIADDGVLGVVAAGDCAQRHHAGEKLHGARLPAGR